MLPAAACARAFVEGVAAFTVEGRQLEERWESFKAGGPHGHCALLDFRAQTAAALAQPQFGTRLPSGALERTNVLTLLEKFRKLHGDDVGSIADYGWLCDAVHPSFGSHRAYFRAVGNGPADAWIGVQMEREFLRAGLPQTPQNEVADAIADVLVKVGDVFVDSAADVRAFVVDLGLTTGASTACVIPSWGDHDRPERNDPCPCGSGRRSKRCRHSWGGV